MLIWSRMLYEFSSTERCNDWQTGAKVYACGKNNSQCIKGCCELAHCLEKTADGASWTELLVFRQTVSVFNNIFKGVSTKSKTKKQNRLHLNLGKVNFQMPFIWITIMQAPKLKSNREIEEDWCCVWWIIDICK